MASEVPTQGFETLQIHAGTAPDPATGARQTPIYQTTSYVFRDAEHAAKLFNLQEAGYIYSRLTNPTIAVLQDRVAALEGGAGAVACSSGHAAQIMALFPLLAPGQNIVASNKLYGGTVTQFSHTIRRFGWQAKFVDFDQLDQVKAAIDEHTRAIFCEPIANPGGYLVDIEAIAKIAKDYAGIPLVTDNTTATPYLFRPIEYGATLVVHSTTKYLTGNGTVTGGVIVDSGQFNWAATEKFPALSQPNGAYHGLKFSDLGQLAFTLYGIAVGLRDLGMTMNPQAAHYTLLGIETLSLRMQRHVENTVKVATWLEQDPRVEFVSYAGLPSSPYYQLHQKLYSKGTSGIFTFGIKGGYDVAIKVVDSVRLFSHVANLGDSRSLIIHPASTTHRQLTEAQQKAAGAAPNLIRLSIGLETAEDIIADLDSALAQAAF